MFTTKTQRYLSLTGNLLLFGLLQSCTQGARSYMGSPMSSEEARRKSTGSTPSEILVPTHALSLNDDAVNTDVDATSQQGTKESPATQNTSSSACKKTTNSPSDLDQKPAAKKDEAYHARNSAERAGKSSKDSKNSKSASAPHQSRDYAYPYPPLFKKGGGGYAPW